MDCNEFDERMNALLDRRLRPEHDWRLRAHAARCQSCERILATQIQLFLSVRALASAQRADVVGSRVRRVSPTGEVGSQDGSVWDRSGLAIRYLSVIAATALVAWVGAGYQPVVQRPGSSASVEPAFAARSSQAVQQSPTETRGSGGRSRNELNERTNAGNERRWPDSLAASDAAAPDQSRWQANADRPAGTTVRSSTSGFGVGLPGQVALSLAALDQASIERIVERETGIEWDEARWFTPVQDGLEPLTKSATSTMNVLRMTWPAHRSRRSRAVDGSVSPSI